MVEGYGRGIKRLFNRLHWIARDLDSFLLGDSASRPYRFVFFWVRDKWQDLAQGRENFNRRGYITNTWQEQSVHCHSLFAVLGTGW